MNLARLLATLDELPPHETVELMCHPGISGAQGRYARWGYAWESELADIERRGIVLCGHASARPRAVDV